MSLSGNIDEISFAVSSGQGSSCFKNGRGISCMKLEAAVLAANESVTQSLDVLFASNESIDVIVLPVRLCHRSQESASRCLDGTGTHFEDLCGKTGNGIRCLEFA
jgi:hypothetical protein